MHLCSRRRPRNALDRSWPTLQSRPLLLRVYRNTRVYVRSRETYIYIIYYVIPGMDEKSVTLFSNHRISSFFTSNFSKEKEKKGSKIKESFQKWYYRLEKWRNKEAAKFFVHGKCVAKHRKMATLLGLKRSVNGGRR